MLCAPVVAKEAKEQKKTLQAHYAHLIVHGTLHAQGWDHELEEDAQVMELRETESSKFTLRDTPIFTCVQMPIREALDAVG